MATASRSQLSDLLGAFQHHRLNISEFLVGLLAHSAFTDHPAVDHLLSHTDDVLGAFLAHQQSSRSVLTWANSLIKQKYAEAIRNLTDKGNGWHFVATRAAMGKLEVFEIEDMAREMKEISPELWELIGLLLSADRRARDVTVDDPMDINEDDDLPDSKGRICRAGRDEDLRGVPASLRGLDVAMLFTYIIGQPPWRGSPKLESHFKSHQKRLSDRWFDPPLALVPPTDDEIDEWTPNNLNIYVPHGNGFDWESFFTRIDLPPTSTQPGVSHPYHRVTQSHVEYSSRIAHIIQQKPIMVSESIDACVITPALGATTTLGTCIATCSLMYILYPELLNKRRALEAWFEPSIPSANPVGGIAQQYGAASKVCVG
ncbi:hypothetical protein B0H10DRAFT_2199377 [Mycena sp. CBHHK59/15]|nr:hypothetical protein B0H10DRAFT_2199377 [Mycena sp. CBHHK59/15]